MATKEVITYESDLSGKELEPNKVCTVVIALEGEAVKLDLSKAERNALAKSLQKYMEAGIRVPLSEAMRHRANGKGGPVMHGAKPQKDLAEVRKWLKENGYRQVADRGRIPQRLMEQYESRTPFIAREEVKA